MKKIVIILILLSLSFKGVSQKYRVFDLYSINHAFSKGFHVPSLMMGQSLKIGNQKFISINSGLNLNFPILNKKEIVIDQYDVSSLKFNKSFTSPSLNIPLGVEIGYKKIAIGAVSDLFGISFGKQYDTTNYQIFDSNISDLEGFTIKNGGVNFILASKEKRRNLNSQVYILFTPGDTFSIKFGLTSQTLLFNSNYTRNNNSVNYRDYRKRVILPSIGINFKIEK